MASCQNRRAFKGGGGGVKYKIFILLSLNAPRCRPEGEKFLSFFSKIADEIDKKKAISKEKKSFFKYLTTLP